MSFIAKRATRMANHSARTRTRMNTTFSKCAVSRALESSSHEERRALDGYPAGQPCRPIRESGVTPPEEAKSFVNITARVAREALARACADSSLRTRRQKREANIQEGCCPLPATRYPSS